jgi:arsenate reductase (glutaredoxin)
MTTKVYGIPNCDTIKKARAWLDGEGIAYAFHDYKKVGVDPVKLATWCKLHGWEKVLNRAGTTFKKLPEAAKAGLDQSRAIQLMLAQPSMIKRPIVEYAGGVLIGFDPKTWMSTLH